MVYRGSSETSHLRIPAGEDGVKHNHSVNSFDTISKRNVKDSALDTTLKPTQGGKTFLSDLSGQETSSDSLQRSSASFSLKRFFYPLLTTVIINDSLG